MGNNLIVIFKESTAADDDLLSFLLSRSRSFCGSSTNGPQIGLVRENRTVLLALRQDGMLAFGKLGSSVNWAFRHGLFGKMGSSANYDSRVCRDTGPTGRFSGIEKGDLSSGNRVEIHGQSVQIQKAAHRSYHRYCIWSDAGTFDLTGSG